MMDMSQYLEIFIEESKEHLLALNQSLLVLEKNPDDTAMLNEIFRVAHTLKGMAGTMGYNRMGTLTHDMENVLQAIRNNELKISTELIDLLFKCLDALESYVDNIVNTGTEGTNDYTDIIKALGSTLTGKDQKAVNKPAENTAAEAANKQSRLATADFDINQYEQNVINKAADVNMNAYKITVLLNKGCVLKSARAFVIFQCLEKNSEIIRSQPCVQDIEDEKFDFEFTVVVVSKQNAEFLNKELNGIAEVDDVIIEALESKPVEVEEKQDDNQYINNETMNDTKAGDDGDTDAGEHEAAKVNTAAVKPKTGKTVRVDIERLDVLMNWVSELIITKTRLEGLNSGDRSLKFNEAVEYLERITTNLNDAVMKVRMVPVETVFNRFPRMIRDISRELGKEIDLLMTGEETELDRTVIDEIGDPLIHLLRNSADHGIESTEQRKKLGKPEAGHIYLRAYQAGNNVVIEVEDDGQGINIEKVKKKAIEKGLINKDIANSISNKDIIELLFKPSFSTADKVTDLSGRGVGLDVVKTKIEALGGVVEVETQENKGSKFIIRLPLTLAIMQALLVLIGAETYAIPLNSIKEIINISPDEIKLVQKQEVILLRNTVVPIVRLDRVLEVVKEEEEQKQLTVVIVKKGDKLSGFLVDHLIGQQEIVIKSLGKLLVGIKCIAGATILGDGNVALILDVNSLA